jgi:hypothetical protein
MCIVHKGFRGFRAVSLASILGGNLIGLKPVIPYDTIHLTLPHILKKMQKLTIILLIILFSTGNIYSQDFRENSIGVASVKLDLETEYEIEIVFPFKTISNYKIKRPILEWKDVIIKFINESPITLFDDKGELTTINFKDSIKIEFWCENDGGIQYRPTFTTRIKKQNLKRVLKTNIDANIISCFVITNKKDATLQTLSQKMPDQKIKLKGDIDADGKAEAIVWAEIDDSGICDLSFHLSFGENDYYINCCGP